MPTDNDEAQTAFDVVSTSSPIAAPRTSRIATPQTVKSAKSPNRRSPTMMPDGTA